mgnify:CR=1 FL=1
MKKYKVNVNGSLYEITLEVVDDVALPESAPAAQATAPAASAAPTAQPAPSSEAGAGTQINAPMPGTILSVSVAKGDTVKKGQVLVILEAMKMENEIMSPCDGVITSVNVAQGAAVDTGALICSIQ